MSDTGSELDIRPEVEPESSVMPIDSLQGLVDSVTQSMIEVKKMEVTVAKERFKLESEAFHIVHKRNLIFACLVLVCFTFIIGLALHLDKEQTAKDIMSLILAGFGAIGIKEILTKKDR